MAEGFLPVSKEELNERGIGQPDFIYVCGDAYVDHPSFGSAIISRVLESRGYSVAMLCQPDYHDPQSIAALGRPRLAFLVSSGNMDSMVLHYTVAKKRRHEDLYSPGGAAGKRPDRAVTVYCNMIRKCFGQVPVVIGGIEASLRRLSHYDYWSDRVRRSVLLESGADLISYGMGEKSIVEIADALAAGIDIRDITYVRGTVWKTKHPEDLPDDSIRLPDFSEVSDPSEEGKKKYAESYALQYRNTDPFTAHILYESYGHTCVVQNPPAMPLTQLEMDDVYALPYMRDCHPMYKDQGGIPALSEIRFSLTSNRGCFGECNFCALTMHEGRIVQARSHESIIREAELMIQDPEFKGYIHDVGGPTAEFRGPACSKQLKYGACTNKRCLWPKPCRNLIADHSDYVKLLRELRALPGVKKVFVRSGIRFDYLLADPDRTFLSELCRYHVSGQLRVAPEHVSARVLRTMGKPAPEVYRKFAREFEAVNKRIGKEQYLVPYLMSSHPGSRMEDAVELALFVRDIGYMPEQVQDFYPTPGTVSTAMYYTGLDPLTGNPVYVERDPHRKAMQRALIQYRKPENYSLVREALEDAGREDLIGFGKECLIRPYYPHKKNRNEKQRDQKQSGQKQRDQKQSGQKHRDQKHSGREQGERSASGKNRPHGRRNRRKR